MLIYLPLSSCYASKRKNQTNQPRPGGIGGATATRSGHISALKSKPFETLCVCCTRIGLSIKSWSKCGGQRLLAVTHTAVFFRAREISLPSTDRLAQSVGMDRECAEFRPYGRAALAGSGRSTTCREVDVTPCCCTLTRHQVCMIQFQSRPIIDI